MCLCVWLNGGQQGREGKRYRVDAGNEILSLAFSFFFAVVDVAHCIDGTKTGR